MKNHWQTVENGMSLVEEKNKTHVSLHQSRLIYTTTDFIRQLYMQSPESTSSNPAVHISWTLDSEVMNQPSLYAYMQTLTFNCVILAMWRLQLFFCVHVFQCVRVLS